MTETMKNELEKISNKIEQQTSTGALLIPKKKTIAERMQEFKQQGLYIIELNDVLVHEPPTFLYAANWNKGISPKSNYLYIQVIGSSAGNICVNAQGYDLSTYTLKDDCYYKLWIPVEYIKILKEY